MNLYKATYVFYKFAKIVNVAPKKPNYTSTMKDNVEYRDRFHGAIGEERQKLIEEEAKKKGFTLVPDKITPVNEQQVIQAVRNIVNKKFPQMDDDMKQEFVFTIVPQIRLETGYKPHNFNFSNSHAYPGWHGKVCVWNDPQKGSGGQRYVNVDWFWRAFDTFQEGIDNWYDLFEKRFPTALAKAANGDVEGFARELKNKGYFTEDLPVYTKGLKRIKEQMRNKYYRDSHQAMK